MKKVLAIVLALVVVVAAFAACGGAKITPYEGSLTDLTASLHEANTDLIGFMLGSTDALDFADEESWTYYPSFTGLESAEGITEGYRTETGFGMQPYSLVLLRTAEGADIEAIKNAMFNGIDTRKWICTEADQLRVVSSADIIMLVMAGSEFAPGLADGMVEAFKTNVGELSGEVLTRG